MTVDGEEERRRLRVGPYVPDSGVEPTDGSAENAVTQLVPVVPDMSADDQSQSDPGSPAVDTVAPAVEGDGGAPTEPMPPDPRAMPAAIVAAEIVGDEPSVPEEPAGAGEHVSAPVPRVAETPLATELVRPGPLVLESDSWDTEPDTDPRNETYHGRRRAGGPTTRLWLATMIILVCLGAAVAFPLALFSSSDSDRSAAGRTTPADAGALVESETVADSPTPTLSQSPSPSVTTPAPSASPRIAVQGGPPPTTPKKSATTSPAPPPFAPATYEAEAADSDPDGITGSAWVWGYEGASGGQIVRNLGNWGSTPGVLRISNVVIPVKGTYAITIHYVHPDNEENRSAVVSVSGIAPINVAFVGGSACCFTKTLTVTLTAGAHTITISNETDHAPSIDKIVISRP